MNNTATPPTRLTNSIEAIKALNLPYAIEREQVAAATLRYLRVKAQERRISALLANVAK